MVKPAAEETAGWQPIETAPRDGTPVLVYLEKPMQGSRIHAAVFRPKVTFIGSHFSFDAPKATHWRPQPAGPGPEKETTS